SCAQVGKGVHLSGGVGLGGVLEAPSARPAIVADGAFIGSPGAVVEGAGGPAPPPPRPVIGEGGAFIGSRAIVAEGVMVEEEAVLAANTVLTASTRIIDVTGPEPREWQGRAPARGGALPPRVPHRGPTP